MSVCDKAGNEKKGRNIRKQKNYRWDECKLIIEQNVGGEREREREREKKRWGQS